MFLKRIEEFTHIMELLLTEAEKLRKWNIRQKTFTRKSKHAF